MTYPELVEKVAGELADAVNAIIDDGVGMQDFMQLVQAGQTCGTAWNALQHLDPDGGVTKERFLVHLAVALASKAIKVVMPLPALEVPSK